MPELTDLIDDLVLLRVPLVPLDGGMEPVEETVDLKA